MHYQFYDQGISDLQQTCFKIGVGLTMEIKKILLIAPPAVTAKNLRDINPLPPMGLGYLAAVLEKLGIEVKILDCLIRGWSNEESVSEKMVKVGLSDKDIECHIRDFQPDMVGVNCQFTRQYKIYHHIFSLVKRVNPDCVLVAGGAHTTVCPEEVLEDANCDFIILGEGEESLRDLVQVLISSGDFSLIDGLGWKSDGKILISPKMKVITDLDSIPYPAYHLMDLESYFGLDSSHGTRHRFRFSPIITSRGCPAKCSFCSAHKVWGDRHRMRSVENVIGEMKLLKNIYKIEELMFEDDNVTANPKFAKELFRRMIEEGFNFIWDTPNGVGVWSMDEEMIDLMKQSGCVKLNFPVESGSQRVLDHIIRKPLKLDKVRHLIKYCKKIGLDSGMFLVVGMPGESIDEMWQSISFAVSCGCYNPHISVATPYPGTKLFQECVNKKLFAKEFHYDDLFIRSFLIRTPEWNGHKLRKTLLKANIYLKLCQLRDEPLSLLKPIMANATNPGRIIGHLKRIFLMG